MPSSVDFWLILQVQGLSFSLRIVVGNRLHFSSERASLNGMTKSASLKTLHLGRVFCGDLLGILPGNVVSNSEEVLLAVVKALCWGRGTSFDGATARHVGLSSGDGSGCGLRDRAAVNGRGNELLLGGKFRVHCGKLGSDERVVLWLLELPAELVAVGGGWGTWL